jgi:hypothetical protein
MDYLMDELKRAWLDMLEPPWRDSGSDKERFNHWFLWLVGWTWALAGLVLGALVAPSLVQVAGFSSTPYEDALVVGVAVLAGFIVQLLGWLIGALAGLITASWLDGTLVATVVVLPLAGVGYGIYRYLTWVGAGQRSVTIAFVGGLLIKTFAIPLIKGIVTGALFKWFLNWLRGGNTKARGV